MTKQEFEKTLKELQETHEAHVTAKNPMRPHKNGGYNRFENPCVTPKNTPIFWRYDLAYHDNPYLIERMGINATFNCGAFKGNIELKSQ